MMKDLKELIGKMTLEEKAGMCSGLDFWHLKGIERLGIPSIMVTDGPHGLRKQAGSSDHVGLNESVPATCFPTASALAATWNRELVYQVGVALGEECLAEKVGVILGPGANIKRSPLCGRNFEYFSEDPYLSGEMAKSHINGVQSQGVGTSLKHYAVNNQEYRRMVIDAVVDERALQEIYLAGYEIAVKGAQPWTVMCAYNKVNGTYACEHPYLMTEMLKEAWGHEGLVVTDWGAMNERVAALAAGTELEMPGSPNGNDEKIAAAIRSGELDEAVMDRAVERILQVIFKAAESLENDYDYDRDAHHALARRVAGEGAVLLKNKDSLLPLPKLTRVAVIGQFAKLPRYQGAGSSSMNPTRLDNIYDEMVKLVGGDVLRYAPGYPARGEAVDEGLIAEALAVAQEADVVVVCTGLSDLFEVEGLDRQHMRLPASHNALIEALAAAHPRVVVVLSNGSPVEMPWEPQVQAILEGYLGGQAGAGAIADIVYGDVNPSGKLGETFPLRLEDNPFHVYFPGGPDTVEYRESIYVGYRYFDTAGKPVLYPFGHGLSYTCFEYHDLQVSPSVVPESGKIAVSLRVKNTGKRAGQEIVQLYVRDREASIFRPAKELKGFEKVALEPGEEKQVRFELDHRAFAFYHTGVKDWQVEAGAFEILVGASSADIRLRAEVQVEAGPLAPLPLSPDQLAPYYQLPTTSTIPDATFEALLGRPLPANQGERKGAYTLNSPVGDMQDSPIGRLLGNVMQKQMQRMIQGQEDTPIGLLMEAMAREMPLRAMLMTGGAISREMLEALLVMINGNFFKGLGALVKARRTRKK
jgi:beta-glucosidase